MIDIVCISDTHERHNEIRLPIYGDILICSGDVTYSGKIPNMTRFLSWMDRQDFKHKILVAGNHDFCFEEDPAGARRLLRGFAPSVVYLQDEMVEVMGLKIWGSPWQPRFHDWAFNLDRGDQIAEKWKLIPEDTDILVTHGPPFGTLDSLPSGMRVGCEALAERVDQLSLKMHVFGHVHHGYGMTRKQNKNGTMRDVVNAAICDENYRATHRPIVVTIEDV